MKPIFFSALAACVLAALPNASTAESTLRINDKMALTTSKDILEAMGEGRGPRNVIVSLGYAGWDQGQLEHEMTENTWLTVPASEHILFDLPPDELLQRPAGYLENKLATLDQQADKAQLTAPLLAPCPTVTVFHDLQHKRHPEHFRRFDLPFWRFFLYWSAPL